MWLEAICKSESDAAGCPTCGGGIQRRAYGEMYAGSFILDGFRVEMRRVPREGFIDAVCLDPITTYFNGKLYRARPSDPYLAAGAGLLHRLVWEDAFGAIPDNCHIHHVDGNPKNNKLSNLECLDAREHMSKTWEASRRAIPAGKHFSDNARRKAAEWHSSEAGRLWHKRHAERSKGWLKWGREDKPCAGCGVVVKMLVRKSGCAQKYCTTNCKAATYRARKKVGLS